MNTLQATQAELDRFFGPRQVNRNLIHDALAGASHIFVHTHDDHRVRPRSGSREEESAVFDDRSACEGGDSLVRRGSPQATARASAKPQRAALGMTAQQAGLGSRVS